MSKRYDPIVTASNTLQEVIEPLDVPGTIEEDAIDLFKRVHDKTDAPNNAKSIEQVVTACFILAARDSTELYTAEGVVPFTSDSIDTTDIHTVTRYILTELDIDNQSMFFQDPHKHVDKIGRELDVAAADIERAHEFISILQAEGAIGGRKAGTVAASVVYLIGRLTCDHNGMSRYVQKDIAEATNVCEVSIRNSYTTFAQILHSHPEADITFEDMWWL